MSFNDCTFQGNFRLLKIIPWVRFGCQYKQKILAPSLIATNSGLALPKRGTILLFFCVTIYFLLVKPIAGIFIQTDSTVICGPCILEHVCYEPFSL